MTEMYKMISDLLVQKHKVYADNYEIEKTLEYFCDEIQGYETIKDINKFEEQLIRVKGKLRTYHLIDFDIIEIKAIVSCYIELWMMLLKTIKKFRDDTFED